MWPRALSSIIELKRLAGRRGVWEAIRARLHGGGDYVRFAVDLTAWQPPTATDPAIEIHRGLAELHRARASLAAPPQFYEDRIRGARRPYLGVWNGGVGHISWVLTHDDRTRLIRLRPGEVELDGAYTFPEYRGRGLPPAVERAILSDVKREGIRVAYTHVAVENRPALRGVRKTGFCPVGIVRLRWLLGAAWVRYTPFETADADERVEAYARQADRVDVAATAEILALEPAYIDATPRLAREVLEREEWNAHVLSVPGVDLEQGWEWGEVMRASGWRAHRYTVLDGGACVGAISLAEARLPLLGHSILYASRGPVLDPGNDAAWAGVLEAIRYVAARTRPVFLRVSSGRPRTDVRYHEALLRHGFRPLEDDWTTWNAPRIVVTMSLAGDEAELRRRLRKTIRQEISLAARRAVTVRAARSEAEILRFHGLLATIGRQKEFPVRRLERFRALWHHYVLSGQGVLLLAEHEGALVGGLLGARFGRRGYLQCAAVRRDGAHLHQGPLLYWEFIRWAKAAGCEAIDWGGSGTHFPPRAADSGYGVCQFKLGFGGQLEYRLGYYDLVFVPALYHLVRASERWLLPFAWKLRARVN